MSPSAREHRPLIPVKAVDHPDPFTYWQPMYWLADLPYRLEGLQCLADWVLDLHVFHWPFRSGAGTWGESRGRRPLAEGAVT